MKKLFSYRDSVSTREFGVASQVDGRIRVVVDNVTCPAAYQVAISWAGRLAAVGTAGACPYENKEQGDA